VLLGQHILASGLEGRTDGGGRLDHITNAFSNQHLVFRSLVLLLEGLSEDFCDLLSRSRRLAAQNEFRIFQQELSQVLILGLRLFHIVSDGESVNPESSQLLSHLSLAYIVLLELDNFTDAGNCVVSSMVKLRCFSFLFLDFSSHLEFNCVLESLKAMIGLGGKSVTSVGRNNTNTIGSCLTKTSALVTSKTADCLNNHCVVSGRKVVGSKMFNHVIKNEKAELFTLLNFTSKRFVKSGLAQSLDYRSNHRRSIFE